MSRVQEIEELRRKAQAEHETKVKLNEVAMQEQEKEMEAKRKVQRERAMNKYKELEEKEKWIKSEIERFSKVQASGAKSGKKTEAIKNLKQK